MSEDSLEKFVANMRAVGQSDEFIARNLLDAGHNKLVVLNALGISSLDELHEDEADDTTPSQMSVDENGNLSFVREEPVAATEPSPTAPGEALAPQQPQTHPNQRHYPRPTGRRQMYHHSEPHSEAEITQTFEHSDASQPAETSATTTQEFTERRPIAANAVHSIGVATSAPRSVQTSKPTPVHHTDTEQHPHTYQETMHDLAEHKEIEASSHHDLASGIPSKEVPSSQQADTPPPQENTQEPAAPAVSQLPPKDQPHDKILPETPQKNEPLPQELNTDDLEMVDGDLHNMKKDIDELDLQNKKAPTIGPLDAASFAHQVTESEKIGAEINQLRNNVWLQLTIIIVCVGILIGLAFTVMSQL